VAVHTGFFDWSPSAAPEEEKHDAISPGEKEKRTINHEEGRRRSPPF
jgi:hypothetical protein